MVVDLYGLRPPSVSLSSVCVCLRGFTGKLQLNHREKKFHNYQIFYCICINCLILGQAFFCETPCAPRNSIKKKLINVPGAMERTRKNRARHVCDCLRPPQASHVPILVQKEKQLWLLSQLVSRLEYYVVKSLRILTWLCGRL